MCEIPPPNINDTQLQALLLIYEDIRKEIRFIKNRDWQNVIIFVGAIYAIILFVADKDHQLFVKEYPNTLKAGLIILSLGCFVYNYFNRKALITNRNLLKQLDWYFKTHEIKQSRKEGLDLPLLPFSFILNPLETKPLREGYKWPKRKANKAFYEGFFSIEFLFFPLCFIIAISALAIYGILLINIIIK